MLKEWKQQNGLSATYQALCDALRHDLVQREDLTEKFCYLDGNCVGLMITAFVHRPELFVMLMGRERYSDISSLNPYKYKPLGVAYDVRVPSYLLINGAPLERRRFFF